MSSECQEEDRIIGATISIIAREIKDYNELLEGGSHAEAKRRGGPRPGPWFVQVEISSPQLGRSKLILTVSNETPRI